LSQRSALRRGRGLPDARTSVHIHLDAGTVEGFGGAGAGGGEGPGRGARPGVRVAVSAGRR
jgi:hypothetical protein